MIDNVNQENTEESSEKEEPDFFEEHSNSDNINSKIDQSPALSSKKVCALCFEGFDLWKIPLRNISNRILCVNTIFHEYVHILFSN